MLYSHIIDGSFAEAIGADGITAARYESMRSVAVAAYQQVQADTRPENVAVLEIPDRRDDLAELRHAADRIRDRCSDILIIGTGGSTLGARTFCALAAQTGPNLHFLENVDPTALAGTLNHLDAQTTGAVLISKSGGTLETMSVAMIVLDWLQKHSADKGFADRCVAITEARDNPLHRLASHTGISVIPHDPNIGGRYSAFSAVGLLPAMIVGMDVAAIRAGGQAILTRAAKSPETAPPVEGAAITAALVADHGISISVLMPYRDQLSELTLWYRQLWAESLGKDGHGTTPVQAHGTVDQHSQLQLYLDGPADKFLTFITCPASGSGPIISPILAEITGMAHVADRAIGDVLDACSGATAEAIANSGRPSRELRLSTLDEMTIGAVMMHFILETLITARLWDINPYGQPAVETGKELARAQLTAGLEKAS